MKHLLVVFFFVFISDPRTNHWPLIGSPWPMTAIIVFYLYFIYVAGPKYMKKRKPYGLKRFIQLFDVFQIVANYLIVKGFFDGGWYQHPWIYCQPFEFSYEPGPYKVNKIIILSRLVLYLQFRNI